MADVTLRVTIEAASVEVTGSEEYAERKLEELLDKYLGMTKPGVSAEARPAPIPLETGGKRLSVGEFMRRITSKNLTDRALGLAYYLEKVEGASSFTTGELAAKGKEAKYPFANISDVVARLAARGLMMSAGDKESQRAYALTASGEQVIESMLEAPPK